MSARSLETGLTRRQAEAILVAQEMGYYQVPRRATTAQLAARMGIARSTFEEHLLRAERRAVDLLIPHARAVAPFSPPSDTVPEVPLVAYSRDIRAYVAIDANDDHVKHVTVTTKPPRNGTASENSLLSRLVEHIRTGRDDFARVRVGMEQLTKFEREVLTIVRDIPAGATKTWSEIAKTLGKPLASRAVGNAVARNPTPIIIPTHRVTPSKTAKRLGRMPRDRLDEILSAHEATRVPAYAGQP